MLAGGARTGTVGYGEQDGPPADLGPGLKGAVAADERDGGAWRAGPVCCQTPPSARSLAGPHRRSNRPWLRCPPDGLPVPAWLTWHHGAVGKPAVPGRASVVGTVSPLCRNAVLQYCSIHGRHRRACAQAGATDRETCGSCAGCGARHACRDCLRGVPVRQKCAGGA